MMDDGPFRLATAVKLKLRADGKPSTVNDASDCDTGYTAELRLPWRALAPLAACRKGSGDGSPWNMAGCRLRILAVVQNGDLPASVVRYHTSTPYRRGGYFHQNISNWPIYWLNDTR